MARAVTNLATDMKGFLEATFLGTVMVKALSVAMEEKRPDWSIEFK